MTTLIRNHQYYNTLISFNRFVLKFCVFCFLVVSFGLSSLCCSERINTYFNCCKVCSCLLSV